jgi:sarcosine oxidase
MNDRRDDYGYAVIGAGGLGSAVAYRLALRAGSDVVALEQFELGHVRGGSQDHSRIIRNSYHDAIYTALTPETFAAWAEVEEKSGVPLVVPTGGIVMADASSEQASMPDVYASALEVAGLPYERLDTGEILRRWPQFRFDADVVGVYEEAMGLVDAAKGNAVHQTLARAHGATILEGCTVLALESTADGVLIHMDGRTIAAQRVVIAAGAWTDALLEPLGRSLRLRVTQEQVTYYRTPNLRDFAIGRFPTWVWEGSDLLYGFPVYGEVATKVAIDAGGHDVTAGTRTFDADPERERRQHAWLERHLPAALGPILYTKTCLYDMPPDRNFVLDRLPEHPQILVASGAGHAYKFAALIGRIMSELAIDGATSLPIDAFSIGRPALRDPGFEPNYRL